MLPNLYNLETVVLVITVFSYQYDPQGHFVHVTMILISG